MNSLILHASEDDAFDAGIPEANRFGAFRNYLGEHVYLATPQESFRTLWDFRYADRGYASADDPLVWTGGFEVVK